MAIELMNVSYEEHPRNMELHKMKSELTLFVNKMKSEGFLTSVDYQDIQTLHEVKKAK